MSKKNTNKNNNHAIQKKEIRRNRIIKKMLAIHHPSRSTEAYKKGLLEVDKQEDKYDKLFEQKLAEQYREFRNLKEHHMLLRKFVKIAGILIIIVLVALLLLSFS